jgi:O-antigen/teichoic acid export membrane protein
MAIDRRILENTSILAGSQLVAQIANFGFVIILARAFGAETLGEYSFAMSLGALLAVLAGLGSRKLVLRMASETIDQWRELVGVFLPVQSMLSILMLALVVLGAHVADLTSSAFWIIALACSFKLIVPFSALISTGFSAQERMFHSGAAEAFRSIAIFVIGSTVVWIGLSAQVAVAIMPLVAVSIVIVLYLLAHQEFGAPYFRFGRTELIIALRRTLPFLGIALASVLFLRVGVLMLRSISGAQAVGLFSAAERMIAAVVMLQTMFVGALFPQLVRLWTTNKGALKNLTGQGQRLIVLTSLPVATVLALFAEDIILLLFGQSYTEAADVLRILAWMLAIRGINAITSAAAIAQSRQLDLVGSKLIGLLVLASVCAVLAPGYGAVGLAIAVVSAELSVLVAAVWRLGDNAFLSLLWAPVSRTFAACCVSAGVAFALVSHDLWIRAGAVAGAGVLSLWLFRAVYRHDIQHLLKLTRAHPPNTELA